MSVEGDGSLFFQPTAMGSCSERTLRVKNLSRVPVEFKWRLWGSDQRVLTVLPDTDTLQPNESKVRLQCDCGILENSSFSLINESIFFFCFQVQKWSFAPIEEMMYSMKPSLTFWPVQMPQCKKSRLTIKAVGLASKGSLQVCYLNGINNSFNHIYNGANMIYLALGWLVVHTFLSFIF